MYGFLLAHAVFFPKSRDISISDIGPQSAVFLSQVQHCMSTTDWQLYIHLLPAATWIISSLQSLDLYFFILCGLFGWNKFSLRKICQTVVTRNYLYTPINSYLYTYTNGYIINISLYNLSISNLYLYVIHILIPISSIFYTYIHLHIHICSSILLFS